MVSPLFVPASGSATPRLLVTDARAHKKHIIDVIPGTHEGGFVRHIVTDLSSPHDVEEVDGGWLVAGAASNSVQCVRDGDGFGRLFLGRDDGWLDTGDGQFNGPVALALVPGFGLVVREDGGARLQVFINPDTMAMGRMSPIRLVWMVAAVRAVARRCADRC